MKKVIIGIIVVLLSTVYLIANIFAVYVLVLRSTENDEYRKYYSDTWNYKPTDKEKEFIVYLGELGYTCYLQYMDGEGEPTRFTELTFDDINNNSYVNIFCEQYIWDDIKEITPTEVNGSYYVTNNVISFDSTLIQSEFYIYKVKDEDENANFADDDYRFGLIYSTTLSNLNKYAKEESYKGEEFFDKMLRDEISTIVVTGSSVSDCELQSYDDEDIDNLILYGEDIVMNENLIFPEDLEESENAKVEYLKKCNDMVKHSDASIMYHDIILPRNEEVKGIIEYGDNLLN